LYKLSGVFSKTNRIVGGHSGDIRNFPYLVSFRVANSNKHFCAGSIILPDAVLTSASCLYTKLDFLSRITIHAGASNLTDLGTIHEIKKAMVHPEFVGNPAGSNGYHNDIAIVLVRNKQY
jgi:secreted trypsin-like serine protease